MAFCSQLHGCVCRRRQAALLFPHKICHTFISLFFFFSPKSSNLLFSPGHHRNSSAVFEQQDLMNQFISELEPHRILLRILIEHLLTVSFRCSWPRVVVSLLLIMIIMLCFPSWIRPWVHWLCFNYVNQKLFIYTRQWRGTNSTSNTWRYSIA